MLLSGTSHFQYPDTLQPDGSATSGGRSASPGGRSAASGRRSAAPGQHDVPQNDKSPPSYEEIDAIREFQAIREADDPPTYESQFRNRRTRYISRTRALIPLYMFRFRMLILFGISAMLLSLASVPISSNSVVDVQFSNFNDLSIGNIQGVTQISVSLSTYYVFY